MGTDLARLTEKARLEPKLVFTHIPNLKKAAENDGKISHYS